MLQNQILDFLPEIKIEELRKGDLGGKRMKNFTVNPPKETVFETSLPFSLTLPEPSTS
jgi:hypothetical protein